MAVGSDWRDLCLLILGPACFASLGTLLSRCRGLKWSKGAKIREEKVTGTEGKLNSVVSFPER